MDNQTELVAELDKIYGTGSFEIFNISRPWLRHASLERRVELFRQESIVNETKFFRYPEQMRYFRDVFLRFHMAGQRQVRVASVACSTGEEVYSILLSTYEDRERLKIDAFDINPENLARARAGFYIVKEQDPYLLIYRF